MGRVAIDLVGGVNVDTVPHLVVPILNTLGKFKLELVTNGNGLYTVTVEEEMVEVAKMALLSAVIVLDLLAPETGPQGGCMCGVCEACVALGKLRCLVFGNLGCVRPPLGPFVD